MAFYLKKGKAQGENYEVPASTTVSVGAVMRFDGVGRVIPTNATTTHLVMVATGKKLSTDGDYASATQFTGVMLNPELEFECDTVTGTATAGMVGKSYDLNASGEDITVNLQATGVVTVTKYISATKVWCRFNSSYLINGGRIS